MYKILSKFLFQILLLIVIIRYFFKDIINHIKIVDIFSIKYLQVFLLLVFINLVISLIFYWIISIISRDKLKILSITKIFIEGGIVNQLFYGLGLIYKSFKFKNMSKNLLTEYGFSQLLFSLISIFSYLILATFFGFLNFKSLSTYYFIGLIVFIIVLATFLINYKHKIIRSIKRIIKINIKNDKYIEDLRIIKKSVLINKQNIFVVFLCFTAIAFITCYTYHILLISSNINTSFFHSSFVWISSLLFTTVSTINFMGFFELVLGFSGEMINLNFSELVASGLILRGINISSQIILLIGIYIISQFNNSASFK